MKIQATRSMPPGPQAQVLHQAMPEVAADTFERMSHYIDAQWSNLRRCPTDLATLRDEKASDHPVLYCPQGERPVLPPSVTRRDVGEASPTSPGLLYVPHDYVVPGGRFNEQYGWDSYFTVRGLLADGHTDLARGMVDNLLYEVENYGKVLNANRTYYLGRSSPPFLTSALLAVYRKTNDREWLARALPTAIKEHDSWTDDGPYGHRTPNGLSRYASDIGKPCPEVEHGYYANLPDNAEFFRQDRAERESGWDMTDRFGYRCMDFNPVDLNALLYREERDIGEMTRIVKGEDSPDARTWDDAADIRRTRMNATMWDKGRGMFHDFDHVNAQPSTYESLATFAPLWAGLATQEQAQRVRDNLFRFEKPGGLATSTHVSGKQWDAPYGWPPLQLLAVEGLRRYGFHDDANRLEKKFVTCVASVFETDGAILEKYNVVDMSGKADVGYGNQVGFGWTNATVRVFCNDLAERLGAWPQAAWHVGPGATRQGVRE